MAHTISESVRRALVFALVGALGCGGGDLLLPDPPGGGSVALTKVDGDAQVGTVGEALPSLLVVQVLSERQQPVAGRVVEFAPTSDSAAGQVSPQTALTDAAGEAKARWVLGTLPGSHVVTARIVDDTTATQVAEFTATAKAAAPDTIAALSSQSQSGRRNGKVDTQPVVRVVDRFGNPVQDVPVVWLVTAGEGRLEQATTATDADGTAGAQWTLGNRLGIHRLTATVGGVTGSPVTFSATVLF
jgi:hypothetical protein